MQTSSKLIQKYYHAHMSHRITGIIGQVDTSSQMAARILGADFTAIFYQGADNNHFVPVAYQYGHHLNIKYLGELENYWGSIEPLLQSMTAELIELGGNNGTPSDVNDSFGMRNGFSHRYQYPLYLEGQLRLICLAYWFQPVESVSLDISTMLDLICRITAYAMANVDHLMLVENYSSRLSDILPIFEVPLGDLKFRELVSVIMKRLCDIVPEASVFLFGRDADSGLLVFEEAVNSVKPEDSFIQFITSQVEPQLFQNQTEDTAKYRCRNLSAGQTGNREIVALQITPDLEHQYIPVICTEEDYILSHNDRELLSVFAVFAQTVLRNALLVKRLKKANRLLEESSARLANVETVAALADMTSGLAHDFNNLLGGIIGRVQLMQLRVKDDKILADLGKIENLATEGAETVRRIQEFTTVTSPKNLKRVDLCRIVHEALANENIPWRQLAVEKQVEINSRFGIEEAIIEGNHNDLVTAIHKLIENAVEHSPENKPVEIVTELSGKKIQISVHDSGPGIPQEIWTKIFYPFFTTKSVRGAGLGLAIVHGIVGRLGGKVTVHSHPETGTTFTITFRQSNLLDDVSEITQRGKATGQLKVLVVDDDSEVREVLKDMLGIDGHEVVDCSDGYKALEAIADKPFDVMITDLGMPGMSGMELAEEVHNKYPHIPIAMITGWGAQLDQKEAELKGIKKVLAKPFHLKEITSLVEDLIHAE